jgi:hypothetical protein
MVNWEHLYVPRIARLIGNPDNQLATAQLLGTSQAPFDVTDPLGHFDDGGHLVLQCVCHQRGPG